MKRRTALGAVATGVAVALAGCVSSDGDEATPATNSTDTAEATATATTTPEPIPVVDSTDYTWRGTYQGERTDDARIVFGDGEVSVVNGVIWASNTCIEAGVQDVSYDEDADTLSIAVATNTVDNPVNDCEDGPAEIEYNIDVTFQQGLPGTVVLTHDRGDGPVEVVRASP